MPGVASKDRQRVVLPNCPMKPGKITHTLAALLSSLTSLFAHGAVTKAEPGKVKLSKKSETKSDDSRVSIDSLVFAPSGLRSAPPSPGER